MRTWIGVAGLAIGLIGCQHSQGIVGTWKYGRDTVEFRPDHTFVEKDPKGQVGGMWIQTGEVVTLTPETVGTQSVSQFKTFVVAKAKTPALKATFSKVCDQWLAIDNFKLNADGISMDIVDPSGKRRDSMMRAVSS